MTQVRCQNCGQFLASTLEHLFPDDLATGLLARFRKARRSTGIRAVLMTAWTVGWVAVMVYISDDPPVAKFWFWVAAIIGTGFFASWALAELYFFMRDILAGRRVRAWTRSQSDDQLMDHVVGIYERAGETFTDHWAWEEELIAASKPSAPAA